MKITLLSSFLWLSTTVVFAQSACFSSANDNVFPGPTNAQCLEKGDFDNDGKLDVIVGNFTNGTNKLNFLKGNGNGSFQAPVLFEGGERPLCIKAGDYNVDGNLDILVSNFATTPIVSVLLGNGNGTFGAPVTYSMPSGPFEIGTADFNEDGAIDFAVSVNNGLKIFLGSLVTPGTFTDTGYLTMSTGARGLITADFNNDGNVDVATSNTTTSNVSVRFGDGLGGFAAASHYTAGSGCFLLTCGDYDGDGDMDIATTNFTVDNISILLNNGTGTFAAAVNYAAGDEPENIVSADFNNDGKLDIAVNNKSQNSVSLYLSLGNGTFLPQQQTSAIGAPRDLVAGLFNADANLDLVISTNVGSVVPVMIGNGLGGFNSPPQIPTGTTPKAIDHADYNGDGNQDAVVANSANNNFSLFLGIGNGTFNTAVTFATQTLPVSIYSGDVNNDTKPDVVTANTTSGTVSVFIGDGLGGFSAATNFNCNASPNFVRLADLNNDNNLDIVVINAANQFSVLLGTGTGSFGAPTAYITGTTPVALVIKAFNGDLFKDIVVVNSGGNNVTVFINSGTATFGAGVNYGVGTGPSSIDAGDIDNDGDQDLVVANYTTNNVSRLLNNGSGVFGVAVNYNSGDSGPKGIVLEDFNGDNRLDVMTVNFVAIGSTGYASLFMGNGLGAFTFYKRFSTGVNPAGLTAADFNNDGRKDVIAVNETSNTITVLLNTTAHITAMGPTSFCSGNSVVLQATASPSYTWSTTETTQSITVTASGSYTLTTNESLSNWCTSTSPAIPVTVTPGPGTPTISASGSTSFCAGGNVILTSSEATGNTWSNGATTPSITVTSSGVYSVTYTSGGCTSSPSTTVTVTVSATPTITAGGPTTFCTGGSVVLTSSIPNNILWSTGETTQSITVTTSGSYTVANSVGGCPVLTSAPMVVTVGSIASAPTITPSGPTTFCAGGSVVLTSSAATGNVWSNGATTPSITVSTAGSYDVHVVDGSCTSPTSAVTTITVNPLPATPTITPGGPTSFCSGGSVVLTSSSATGNLWSNGATTQSITVTTSGTYSVQVTSGGCSATSLGVLVTVNPTPATPTITVGGPTTFCAGGSVVLTSSSATGNLWSNGATTQSITVTTSGSYTVNVTSGPCTSANSAATVVTVNPIPATPTITPGGPTTFCSGGSVVLTSSSATGNLWSTGATTQSITVSASGNYTVAVTTSGCTSPTSAVTTVTVNSTPVTPTITAGGPTSFCTGGSVVLTSSSATGNLWSNGATTQSITVTTSGSYTVNVTAGSCASINSAPTVVTVNATPAVPTITAGGPTTFCSGGSVVLTSSSASNNVWSNGATTQSITVTTTGSYTVEVISGCSSGSSAATNVTVNPTPATPTITPGGPTSFCTGGNVVLTSSSASGNLWSNGATTQSITVSTSGSYTVNVTAGSCTSSNSATTVVTVSAIPPVPTITIGGPTTFCSGNSVVLTSSAASNNLWSNGATTQSITVTASGSYSVAETAGGCSSGSSSSVPVTVNPTPATPTITAGGPTTFCAGGSVVLTSSAASGNLWSTGETTQSITVTTSGSYTVNVTSGPCTSANSATTVVTVNPVPAVPTITAGGPTTFCSGNSVVLTSSSATNNLWSNGATTQSITVTTSGSYNVQVIAAGCSSGSPAPITVTVNPTPPGPTVTAGGPTTFCSGGSVVLTSSAASNNLWSNGATTQSITVSASGSYSVVETTGTCTSTPSATTTVTVNPTPALPTVTVGGATTFCSGGSVVLTSSSATNNLWSNGSTTQSITVTTTGSYSVQVIAAGCSSGSTAPVNVTVNPTPANPTLLTGPTGSFCAGDSALLTSSAATGNTWSTGETTQSIYVTAGGTYSVWLVNGFGCSSAAASSTITAYAMPTAPTVTASGLTYFCAGGSVTLTSSYATGNTWSNGATTQSITVSTAGSYSVHHTNGGGCVSPESAVTDVIIGSIPAAPTITTSTGSTVVCGSGSLTLTSSYTNGNTWSNGALGTAITTSVAGTFWVTFTDGNGCVSPPSTPITITTASNPAAPSISVSGSTTICSGGSVVLTSSVPSGNTWSNTATTPSISASLAGNYTVTYTNAGGCSATSAPVTVTVLPAPTTPTITAAPTTTICPGQTTTLTSSGTNNVWSTGEVTSSITVTTAGPYTVTENLAGCSSLPGSITISQHPVPPVPTITTSGGPAVICEGDAITLYTSTAQADNWSTSETGLWISVMTPGPFTVTTTNGFGCTSTSLPFTVTVNPLPTVTMVAFDSMCNYETPFGLDNGSPLGGTYSGNGVTSNTFDPIAAGLGGWPITYSFTDANNCTNTASQTIHVEDCAGVEELAAGTFSVYPNPSLGYFTIASTLLPIDAVKIYDATGKLVYGQSFYGTMEAGVDLLVLANGVYHAEILSGERLQRVQLVINK